MDHPELKYWHKHTAVHTEFIRFINQRRRLRYYIAKYEALISFSVPRWYFGRGKGIGAVLIPVEKKRAVKKLKKSNSIFKAHKNFHLGRVA